jgi:putative transport protein
VPLPGGASFRLGLAGGPLVVGLVLGRLGRTGRLVWTLPYSANLTLRQLGLVLFLAGVGTRSGDAFVTTLRHGGLTIFLAGALVTCAVATTMLVVGRKVLGIPMPLLLGMVAGIHTQPAALAFASAQAKSDQPNVGYASVYPLATIAKIVLAQLLLALLR